jgi:hypothetical protein
MARNLARSGCRAGEIRIMLPSAARPPYLCRGVVVASQTSADRSMVKESKYLQKQAAKAERVAARVDDPEVSEDMRALATAYRSQAGIVKKKEKSARKAEAAGTAEPKPAKKKPSP